MGIVLVMIVNCGIGYVLVNYVTKEVDAIGGIQHMSGVFFVFIIISTLIPAVCLGLFDEAVVATLQCYAVDTDLHNGEQKFGPKSYHEKLAAIDN